MLARGLFALQAKYGNRTFQSLIGPAETMAREGFPASRAFVRDLAIVAGPLAADPASAAIFFPGGKPVTDGSRFRQTGLAATLSQLRLAGVGDLYQGALAHLLVDAAPDAGTAFTIDDLRGALPSFGPPLTVTAGNGDQIAFLPPPADGGIATEAAFEVLQHEPGALAAADARAQSVAANFRQHGGDAAKLITAASMPAATLPPLSASTSFATLDRKGRAVACALTMNNLFGTGRVIAGTGILLAAAPAGQSPLLAAAIASSSGSSPAFRAAVGGSGQAEAPVAAALALTQALRDTGTPPHPLPTPAPDPGRANVIQCDQYLPGSQASCGWATDPRGAGLAVGGDS
jgi:gamma-glutamyltranspeptidase/glutathione hydrolase